MNRIKQVSFLLLFLMVLLTGCSEAGGIHSNYRDVEQIQLVHTLGLDFDSTGVTVSVSSGNSPENPSPSVMSCHASSISMAMQEIQNYTAQEEFFYAHTRYIVIGESTAEHVMEDIIDFIERSPQLRMDSSLFILKNAKALDLITAATNSQYEITEVLESIERNVEITGDSKVSTCTKTAQSLATSGSALISAISIAQTEDHVFSEDDTSIALPDGYAFLKDGTLLGFLDPDISVGANILKGTIGRSLLYLTDNHGDPVTVQLNGADASFTPEWDSDGSLKTIAVSVNATASVVELTAKANLYDENYLTALDKELSKVLFHRISSVLQASRAYKTDFLELGRTIRLQEPVRFDTMPEEWIDVLPDVRFTLSVKGNLDRTYSITEPSNMDGGGISNAET